MPNCGRAFAIFLISTLISVTNSQVRLETCTLECGQVRGTALLGPSTSSIRGPPGKRGKGGPKGDKGEPANPCECNGMAELSKLVQNLQLELHRTKRALNPASCRDVLPRYESDEGGVYTIYPFRGGRTGVQVFCDLVTDGGGWIVFQKRIDGSEDFYRGWDDYVNGFGTTDGEFWLGLELIHRITTSGRYELRIDMEDFEGNVTYAKYTTFAIGGGTDYAITRIGSYSGRAGHGMPPVGTRFSTKDKDQDTYLPGSCSISHKGGFWYTACHSANPNGRYLRGEHSSYADGVNWRTFRGYQYSLKRMEMKIRLII